MGTLHADFVDDDTSAANRVTAEWLNDVNTVLYTMLGGAPGVAANTVPSNRLAIIQNLILQYLDTKGQLLSSSGSAPTALGVGANGTFLRADSTASLGIKWGSAPMTCEGRLTLATATPVTTADQTAKSTLYFTPFRGEQVSLYNLTGDNWQLYTFAELSIAVPAATAMNDVFLYDNAGTLTLEIVAWTNTTTRATALALQDGVLVKSGSTTHRYLGSFYSATTVTDSVLKRNLFNYYNRVKRPMKVGDATASWEYTTATFRQAGGDTGNQLEYVVGWEEEPINARLLVLVENSTGGVEATPGIGIDSTSTNSAYLFGLAAAAAGITAQATAEYVGFPGIGRHTLVWLEYSVATGTTTWYGGSGVGLVAEVWA